MSYVSQNFQNECSLIQFTPRTKIYFFFKNNFIIFFYILQNFFALFFGKYFYLKNSFKYFFISSFFVNQLVKIFKKINTNLLSFYDNKLTKSYIFWFYNSLINYLKNSFPLNDCLIFSKFFFFNNYFLPVKVFNTNLSNLFYKNIFFNLLFLSSCFFFNNNFFTQYPNNFLNPIFDSSIHSFYGGYFLNIYSF